MSHPQRTCVNPQARQLTLNESVLRPTVMDEGQPAANESGPLTILPPLTTRRRCDASMPASPSSEHPPPTEPVRLGSCFLDLLADLAAREEARS